MKKNTVYLIAIIKTDVEVPCIVDMMFTSDRTPTTISSHFPIVLSEYTSYNSYSHAQYQLEKSIVESDYPFTSWIKSYITNPKEKQKIISSHIKEMQLRTLLK